MGHINIEIKARCKDTDSIRQILTDNHADFKGVDHQTDTYFNVPEGRLKLREGKIENNLIYYRREDKAGPKQSDVILYSSRPGSGLKAILSQALGVLTIVDKKREIYFIGNVKFHLDTVQGLGTFVEIEAIDTEGKIGKDELLMQCRKYMELFAIDEKDLLRTSYSDMMPAGINTDVHSLM
jgi:adenylate cyclase, class 2